MGTTSIIGRLKLIHPDLGFEGGATLEGHVKSTLQKTSDAINSRYFTALDLADTASVDFEHNFKCAFTELRINLYSVDGGGELTRLVSGGSPDLDDFTIIAKVGSTTTHITVTNNTGSVQDIALVVIQGKGAEVLNDLGDVDTTGKEDGQALVYDGVSKFRPGASGDSSFKFQSISSDGTALIIKGGSIRLNDGRILYAASDLTHDVSSLANSDGDWTGLIDLFSLGSSSIVGNRRVYAITTANFAYIKAYADDASNIDLSRYIPCGNFDRASGVYSGVTTFPMRPYDLPIGSDSSLVDSIDYTLIGAVGDAAQLNSGHQLAASSFLSAAIGVNLSWYNLPDVNDDSGNARTLTNNNAATFGTGILGDASQALSLAKASVQYLSSTDVLFDPGDVDFSFACWGLPTNYATSDIEPFCSQYDSVSDKRGYLFFIQNSGLHLYASHDGTDANQKTWDYDLSGYAGWIHAAFRYIASTNTFEIFVNGVKVGSLTLGGNLASRGASRSFKIGSFQDSPGTANSYNGKIDELMFGLYAFSDNDFMKLQAAKYTHNKGMASNAQDWKWWIKTATDAQRRLDYDPIISAELNELFFDLSQEATTAYISRKLFNAGQSGLAKPNRGQTLQLTTNQLDAILPITHNCGGVPCLDFKVSDGTDYIGQDYGSIFKVDATQIKIAGDSLVTLFGTGVSVIITYASGIPSTFVPNKFWNKVVASSAVGLAVNDRLFADGATPFTVTLPASPSVGDECQLIDAKGTFGLTKYVTLDPGASNLRGGANTFRCDIPNKLYKIIYVDATYGWDISI
jgi:hypothetical protein